jgi:hypothetical protein
MKTKKGIVTATGPPGTGSTSVIDVSDKFSSTHPLRAVIFWTTSDTAAGATDGNGILGIGWATNDGGAIQQGYDAYFDTDAAATSNTGRGLDVTASLKTLSAATPTTDMEVDITAWSNTSFTITWTDPPAAAIKIHYFALGGSDTSAARCGNFAIVPSTANIDVTVAASWGQPDLVFILTHHGTTLVSTENAGCKILLGVAKSATERRFVQHQCANAAATMNLTDAQLDNFIAGYSAAAALQMVGDLAAKASWPTNGFRITQSTVSTGDSAVLYLAIKTTAPITIGKSTVPTAAAPQTQNLAIASGVPTGALFFGAPLATAAGVNNAAGDNGGFMFGATDGTNQGLSAVVQDHGNTNSMAGRVHSESRALAEYLATTPTAAPVLQSQASASISGGNVVLNWDDTDSVAREYSYVLFGQTPTYKDGAVNLVGSGSLDAVPHRSRRAATGLTGVASLTVVPHRRRRAATTLSGSGILTTVAHRSRRGATSLAGAASLSVVPHRSRHAATNLTGVGALTVDSVVEAPGVTDGAVSLVGSASLTVTGRRTVSARVALIGSSSLIVAGVVPVGAITVLNDADAVYAGDALADKVYLGEANVWP